MKQEQERKERVRKAYSPKGERGQKTYTFRIDIENVTWLEQQPNKGRAVNIALAEFIVKHNK